MEGWDPSAPGVLTLPSGRLVRGRGLVDEVGRPPEFGIYLLPRPPEPMPWPTVWVRWRDFRLPSDRDAARAATLELWRRAATERVEVACEHGRGRTGTVLACLAVLDGLRAPEAIDHVRRHYHRRAVETPGQRRYVQNFEVVHL
jgi:protein-tyrosine phosphatase